MATTRSAILGFVLILGACKGGASPPPPTDAGTGLEPCAPGNRDCVQLVLSDTGYAEEGQAEELLRSDVTAYGHGAEQFGVYLSTFLEDQRAGEILLEAGGELRFVEERADGDYGPQVATLLSELLAIARQVVDDGGRIQLVVHCATPRWMATHPYEHNVIGGRREASAQPIWACSMPTDLVAWRGLMEAVADAFAELADSVTIVFGNEPDSYFVGDRDDLITWYEHGVRGIQQSASGARYRVGGLTMVEHRASRLPKTTVTIGGDDVATFEEVDYGEPVTQTWIERAGAAGVPIDIVTLHSPGRSPAPKETARWVTAHRDITGWLEAAGLDPSRSEVVIDDFPQWAPYETNDTEYFASHVASGVISMLDHSLRAPGTVRMLQGFLMPYGFRPDVDYGAGYNGVPALINEIGLIKPVYNVNAMFALMSGSVRPVESTDPFVSAVGALDDAGGLTVLVSNHVPVEQQVETLYDFYVQTPITANDFGGVDISQVEYDPAELARVYYDGMNPSTPQLFDDAFAEDSRLDVSVLSWPEEAKTFFRELQRVGQLGRIRRGARTRVDLDLSALPPGPYRLEELVVDGQHANPYPDRAALGDRLSSLSGARRLEEVRRIDGEYGLESGRVRDTTESIAEGSSIRLVMEPSSVHLLRLTPIGG